MIPTTDITLNNAGYMVEPGTPTNPGYKRLQDGYPEGLTQRTSITDFFGGQGRTHQLERDMFATSLAIGPALGGQGVAPWGRMTTIAAATTKIVAGTVDAEAYLPHVIIRDSLYFAIGTRLYKGPVVAPSTGNSWTLLKTYDHPITDITIYGSVFLMICFGNAADVLVRNTTTNAEIVLFAGERGSRVENYSGFAIWIDARTGATPTLLRLVKTGGFESKHVSYDIFGLAVADGELVIITRQALYSFNGNVRYGMVPNPNYTPGGTEPATKPGYEWTGEPKPFYQNGVYTEGQDFTFVAGYGGKTIAWIAGGVHELTPSGDRAGWSSTGLEGRRCFGGTVAAGYVIVTIESHNNQNEIWAYDGNGWWRIAAKPMPAGGALTNVWCHPLPLGQGAIYNNVGIMRHGSSEVDAFRLVDATTSTGAYMSNYAPIAEFVTPLIDAGDRDKIKAWRKIGAVFSSPEVQGDPASTDLVALNLDYSIDGGVTWNALPSNINKTSNTLTNMNFDLERSLAGVTSRFIQLRVRWLSVNNWAPILTGVWIEHEALNSPARRRKWQLRIHARDQEVDRAGKLLTRTGRQLIEELWTAWETDQPLPFRDIDYATDPTERTVRIVGISEVAVHPFDAADWGDSVITLNLVEV